MKRFAYLTFFLLFCMGSLFTQEAYLAYGVSIFHNKTGQYRGTVNGLVNAIFKNKTTGQSVPLILDFQGSKAYLDVVEDKDKIYDTHFNYFTGFTTSGKTKIKYGSYARANAFSIFMDKTEFKVSTMDGAHIEKVKNLQVNFLQDNSYEYLTINFLSDIELNNKQYIMSEYYKKYPGNNNLDKMDSFFKGKEKTLTIVKGSVVIFVIKK